MPIDHPAAGKLKEKFPSIGLKGTTFRGETQIAVPAEHLVAVVKFIKNDPDLAYDMLSDVTCVDYQNYPGAKDRYGMVYIFNCVNKGLPRLTLRVFLNDPNPTVDSLVPLYAGAEWLEREVYDMFGIQFTHHPDLRRILTWDGFKAHPLRKDYPVTGRGEREDYPILSRDSA